MSDTHRIPKVDVNGVNEDDFKCYPLRRYSLSAYSRVVDRIFCNLGLFYIPPDEAAVLVGESLRIDPSYLTDKRPGLRQKLVARLPFLRTSRRLRDRRFLGPYFWPGFSEMFDWDEPPFFKNLLRLEATPSSLTIACYGVTGCGEQEKAPQVQDRAEIRLDQYIP